MIRNPQPNQQPTKPTTKACLRHDVLDRTNCTTLMLYTQKRLIGLLPEGTLQALVKYQIFFFSLLLFWKQNIIFFFRSISSIGGTLPLNYKTALLIPQGAISYQPLVHRATQLHTITYKRTNTPRSWNAQILQCKLQVCEESSC